MQYVRLYTGDDGESHFEDLEFSTEAIEKVPMRDEAELIFRRFPEGRFTDWHTTTLRHYGIVLSGRVAVGLGDGTVREFGPGDLILEEDLTGRGHTTRILSGPFAVATVSLPD